MRTGRVSTPLEDMEKGKSIRQVARRMNICRMTLKQYSEKRREELDLPIKSLMSIGERTGRIYKGTRSNVLWSKSHEMP